MTHASLSPSVSITVKADVVSRTVGDDMILLDSNPAPTTRSMAWEPWSGASLNVVLRCMAPSMPLRLRSLRSSKLRTELPAPTSRRS